MASESAPLRRSPSVLTLTRRYYIRWISTSDPMNEICLNEVRMSIAVGGHRRRGGREEERGRETRRPMIAPYARSDAYCLTPADEYHPTHACAALCATCSTLWSRMPPAERPAGTVAPRALPAVGPCCAVLPQLSPSRGATTSDRSAHQTR